MTVFAEVARHAPLDDSKSVVADLQREIDRLTVRYHQTGDASVLAAATRLARQKESLMKPARMRMREAG
jgi:hypothetical protein